MFGKLKPTQIDDLLTVHIFAKEGFMVSASNKKTHQTPRLVFSELPCLLDPATQRFRSKKNFQSFQCFWFLVFAWTRRAPSPNIPSFPQINAKGTNIWWKKTVFSSFRDPSYFSHPCSRTCLFASLSWLQYWSCFHLFSHLLEIFSSLLVAKMDINDIIRLEYSVQVMTALDAEKIRPLLQLSFLLQKWPGPRN